MPVFRDSHGKRLDDYPRPSVAVDTAVLTVRDDELHVLLVQPGQAGAEALRRLPGTFLHEGETLADAVLRSLREKAGIEGVAPQQLRVFDAPDRDDRGWVLSVAHLVAVPAWALESLAEGASLAPVASLPELAYRHGEIVDAAVAALRAAYVARPDPAGLLGEAPVAGLTLPGDPSEPGATFTLRELQRVHEAVLGETVQRDSFRRGMLPALRETGEVERGGVGKPARVFQVS